MVVVMVVVVLGVVLGVVLLFPMNASLADVVLASWSTREDKRRAEVAVVEDGEEGKEKGEEEEEEEKAE